MNGKLGKPHTGKEGDKKADKRQNIYKTVKRQAAKNKVQQKEETNKINRGKQDHQEIFHGGLPTQQSLKKESSAI